MTNLDKFEEVFGVKLNKEIQMHYKCMISGDICRSLDPYRKHPHSCSNCEYWDFWNKEYKDPKEVDMTVWHVIRVLEQFCDSQLTPEVAAKDFSLPGYYDGVKDTILEIKGELRKLKMDARSEGRSKVASLIIWELIDFCDCELTHAKSHYADSPDKYDGYREAMIQMKDELRKLKQKWGNNNAGNN